ncbi:hypothetical protein H2200_008187 [Cladophialophora chaetospira]|uniref:Glyoxylate reductase n=1 Tax=Cladophialophora chaetospira TaxID=386627 RepID=A0AA38X5A5_9EURO|nr:hypothetical protein H2200_008187 [Cladophialophora chaetospira]
MIAKASKPKVLQLGTTWTGHNDELVQKFSSAFDVVPVEKQDLERAIFIEHLRCRKWGDFDAIIRPVVYSGQETEPWDDDIVSLLPQSLKIYASVGAGYDWMDIPLLTAKGILYCNSGAACTLAVADAALYLVISVFRHFTIAQFGAKTGNPLTWSKTRNRIREIGHNPQGHTVGVVGLGRIGHLVAKKVYFGLGCKIVYHDVERKSRVEAEIHAQYFELLDEMLAVSDCVVVCAPYFGKQIMGAEQFAKCKRGARFVIVSRGQLMDETALVEALRSGHLSAAGLDVYQNEPDVHPELVKMENVTMMPHCAGGSIESTTGFERLCMENIESFFSAGKALTPVNPEAQD